MKATLRAYTPEDFETLYQLDQVCYPPGIAYSKRELRRFLRLPGAKCLVAHLGDDIVGFILGEAAGPHAHVITIDVLEAHRRRGVGTVLLVAIEEHFAAEGVLQVELETATDNHAAVAFWRKHGYRSVAVLPRYYLGRMDAYFMIKALPQQSAAAKSADQGT